MYHKPLHLPYLKADLLEFHQLIQIILCYLRPAFTVSKVLQTLLANKCKTV